MEINPFDVAARFIGVAEVAGAAFNPAIVAMLQLDNKTIALSDDTPWCSAFVNYIAWLLGLERSKSLSARSWLAIGPDIPLTLASPGMYIAIVKRPRDVWHPEAEPGPENLLAPGHVGFYAGLKDSDRLNILGGNQTAAGKVCIESFPISWLLGVRRLREASNG